MKTKLSLILLLVGIRVMAMEGPWNAENSNYVVIGAFASQENAVHFVEKAKREHFDAQFDLNPNRQLFYVYVLHTDNRQLAFTKAKSIRKQSPFSDTWVYSGLLGTTTVQEISADVNPETDKKLEEVVTENTESVTAPAVIETPLPIVVTENKIADKGNGLPFHFKIFQSSDKELVKGDIEVIDADKPKNLVSYHGNEDVLVKAINNSGKVLLQSEVFGYRKIQHAVDFNDLKSAEGVTIENGKVIVPFELVRLQKGDIVIMYNVLFYKDAAIMRPESKHEVTGLLDMMKENPKMKIRIHGHTNGNASGKIVKKGSGNNFFSLSGTKEGFGSAKKLSEERAQIISDFLVSEGVDPSRMEVKAWGGKKHIYEKDHAQASANVRVEIEILED